MLNHCVVEPNRPGAIDAMDHAVDAHHPAGWKVYTMGSPAYGGAAADAGWWLDDERTGIPFLEQARALGVKRVCAHKGMSALVDTGSPRDVGPAARAFPDIDFSSTTPATRARPDPTTRPKARTRTRPPTSA